MTRKDKNPNHGLSWGKSYKGRKRKAEGWRLICSTGKILGCCHRVKMELCGLCDVLKCRGHLLREMRKPESQRDMAIWRYVSWPSVQICRTLVRSRRQVHLFLNWTMVIDFNQLPLSILTGIVGYQKTPKIGTVGGVVAQLVMCLLWNHTDLRFNH